MIQLSYISSATHPMSTQEILGLLRQCREHNAANGVTGMMLYGNNTFLQVLEGEEKIIDDLLAQIRRDSRHANLQILNRTPIQHRQYAEWSMGFRRIAGRELQHVGGLPEFGEKNFTPDYLMRHRDTAQSLIEHFRNERSGVIIRSELGTNEEDRMINVLHEIIRGAVRVLAVLMVVTILWGVVDTIETLYLDVFRPSFDNLRVNEIVVVFGSFMAVLIAIEIFSNITLYLRDDVVHVKLVIATALMAIARKVIVLDFAKIEPMDVLGIAAVVAALGGVYWLIERNESGGGGHHGL